MKSKLFILVLVLVLSILAATPVVAAPFHSTSLRDIVAAPCAPGAAYDPACDVNHDGAVNVADIQLSASHFNQMGVYTSDNNHDHLGQTWTGSNNPIRIEGSFAGTDASPLVLSNTSGFGYGLRVESAGYGLRVDSADEGLRVDSALTGVVVSSAGENGLTLVSLGSVGVYIGHAGNDGVKVDSAGTDGFEVCVAGKVSSCTRDVANNNGVEVASAEDYGVKVVTAGRTAFRSDDSGTNGLYVTTAGDSGVWVADAANWAGYFGSDINVSGNCTGCLLAQLAINSGAETLQAGDIVTMDGIADSPFAGTEMLLQVRRATPGSPLLGVVSGRAQPYISQEDGSATLAPRTGQAAAPGEYLSIVIYGPVQVQADTAIEMGQQVTVDDAGTCAPCGAFR